MVLMRQILNFLGRWIPLGQVDGIKIELDPWLVLMLGLILVIEGWSAFIFWIFVFGFVFIHELAHTFVARKLGYETPEIVIMPFGAAVQIVGMGSVPRHEFYIAIAGPLSNLVIAAILLVANITGSPFINKLAALNLGLALFNLLPIYPMDGGRILRGATRMISPHLSAYEATRRILIFSRLLMVIGLVACLLFCSFGTLIWTLLIAAILWVVGAAELNSLKNQDEQEQ